MVDAPRWDSRVEATFLMGYWVYVLNRVWTWRESFYFVTSVRIGRVMKVGWWYTSRLVLASERLSRWSLIDELGLWLSLMCTRTARCALLIKRLALLKPGYQWCTSAMGSARKLERSVALSLTVSISPTRELKTYNLRVIKVVQERAWEYAGIKCRIGKECVDFIEMGWSKHISQSLVE